MTASSIAVQQRIIDKADREQERISRLVEARRAVTEQLAALDRRIAAGRARIAKLDAEWRSKCRCVATVRVFDGYAHTDEHGDPCGSARYVQRQCLNGALVDEYVCAIHLAAKERQAEKARAAEERA